MIERGKLRHLIVPGYLFWCILLGGSAQAIWGNLILQFCALLLIGWAAVRPAHDLTRTSSRKLLFLVLGLVMLIALQLVP
ncbi:MAG: O-antigen ligase domain-containing protein, partial [Sphingomicrobium sp.]